MIFRITLKDIKAFFISEKKVFIWLLICMICGAFALNYSYSLARWIGDQYENNSAGAMLPRYTIIGGGKTNSAGEILDRLSAEGFPNIDNYQLYLNIDEGYTVAGSSFISMSSAWFTGTWYEGYMTPIENNSGEKVCAVNSTLLDYGDRFKMTGESYILGGEEFTIKGVYESWRTGAGVVIFADKFLEKYEKFDKMQITFSERLNEVQTAEFKKIVSESIENADVAPPPEIGSIGDSHASANRLQYSGIIIMLVVCLVSLIKYWQSVNLPAYTIYWINGATNKTMIAVAMCESMLLCGATYLAGLGLTAVSRLVFTLNAPLSPKDILVGFGIFFGTFAVFTLINTAKICKEFKVTNVRRD